jgi:hypothetical protein
MNDIGSVVTTLDPMKLTLEHLEAIGKIWTDFAKVKLGPYVDQSKKWLEKYKKPMATPETTASA